MKDEIETALEALEQRLGAFRTAMQPDSAEKEITAEMAKFDTRTTGVFGGNALAAIRAEHEAGARSTYDKTRSTDAAEIEFEHQSVLDRLDAVAVAMRQAPREQNAQVDAMRELAALQRFQGRTASDILRTYTETSDAANLTLVGLIERDLDAFRLTPDPDRDVDALPALRKAIEARQLARIPENVRDAQQRARALLKPLNVSQLLAHARSGRGVAVAGTGRPMIHAV